MQCALVCVASRNAKFDVMSPRHASESSKLDIFNQSDAYLGKTSMTRTHYKFGRILCKVLFTPSERGDQSQKQNERKDDKY